MRAGRGSRRICALEEPLRSLAREVHAALYSDTGATYQEVLELLPTLIGNDIIRGIPLLGGHSEDGSDSGGLKTSSPILFDIVRGIVEQWPQPPDPIRGRSLASKTELMQRVNQAYKAGDLLALLELQLSIEQIDPQALAGLAEERLRHYIYVLEEQSRRLGDELTAFVEPFAMAIGEAPGPKLSPASVQRALEADIREIHSLVRTLETDLIRFQDIQALKRSLRDYHIDPLDDMDLDVPAEFRPRRRRRSVRRA